MHAEVRATARCWACSLLQPCTPEGLASFDTFGLAIRRVGDHGTHCAILFQGRDGTPWILHLAWNHKLMAGPVDEHYGWVEASLTPSNKKLLALLADRIWNSRPKIPYGLTNSGVSFDPMTGELGPVPLGQGLTCATFILALLKTEGLRLLDEETWPEGANDDWQRWVVEALINDGADDEQVEAVKATIGSRRQRPAEVVGSATLSAQKWPVVFEEAQTVAAEVEASLIAA